MLIIISLLGSTIPNERKLQESASRDIDFLVTSQGPIEFLVQKTRTFLHETSFRILFFSK